MPETNGKCPDGFLEFWNLLPTAKHRTCRPKAIDAWKRKRPPIEAIRLALEWQLRDPDLSKENYRYFWRAFGYIEGEHWNDEKPAESKPKLQPIHAAMKPATTEEIMEMRRKREEWEAREKERIKGGQDAKSRG
jgi:hypothetical protein